MIKGLKVTDIENTFAISDLHFNHDKPWVVNARGCSDVGEHDSMIVNTWNNVCNDNSTVFHLGDFAIRDPDGSISLRLLKQLKYSKLYMLWGNHNSGLNALYKQTLKPFISSLKRDTNSGPDEMEIYPLSMEISPGKQIVFLGDYVTLRVKYAPEHKSAEAVLCHYAMRNWLHNGKGAWMLCGHSHGNDPHIHYKTAEGRCLDVGWDSLGRPISFKDIAFWMSRQNIIANDHH